MIKRRFECIYWAPWPNIFLWGWHNGHSPREAVFFVGPVGFGFHEYLERP